MSKTLVPVDWPACSRRPRRCGRDGRDLRLLVIVARALFNERGLDGLADGLTLIARTFEAHWEYAASGARAPAATRPSAIAALRPARTRGAGAQERPEAGAARRPARRTFFVTTRVRRHHRPRPRARRARRPHRARESARACPRTSAPRSSASTRRWSNGCAAPAPRRSTARRRGDGRAHRGARARRGTHAGARARPRLRRARSAIAAIDDVERVIGAGRRPVTLPALGASARAQARGGTAGRRPRRLRRRRRPRPAAPQPPSRPPRRFRGRSTRARRSSPASIASSISTTGPNPPARSRSSPSGCAAWCRWIS